MGESTRIVGFKLPSPKLIRPRSKAVFLTLMYVTNSAANLTRVKILQCKRIFTVRELARSQGFPDKFVFFGENDHVVTVCGTTPGRLCTDWRSQMHRQIGNAVAWPVAVAIGREFRKVLIKKWLKERANAIEVD